MLWAILLACGLLLVGVVLSVVTHELGHVLGFDHDEMGVSDTLEVGNRKLPQYLIQPGDTNRDGVFDRFDLIAVLALIDDRAGIPVPGNYRRLQHNPGFRTDRQKRAVGRAPLFAQCRQNDFHDLIVMVHHAEQRRIKSAALVTFGG